MTTRTLSLSLSALICVVVIACVLVVVKGTPSATTGDKPQDDAVARPESSPSYRIASTEIVNDTKLRAQVKLCIILESLPTADGLRDVLMDLFRKTVARRDFHFTWHSTPNYVFIYAFPGREDLVSGRSIAYLAYTDSEVLAGRRTEGTEPPEPDIIVWEKALAALHAGPETRHGLKEEQRRDIYRILCILQRQASEESEAAYPLPNERGFKWEPGKRFKLTQSVNMMGANNAVEWAEKGAVTTELPAGTVVEVVETQMDKEGFTDVKDGYTRVRVRPDGRTLEGWVKTWCLGTAHPLLTDEEWRQCWKRRDRLYERLVSKYETRRLKDYGLTKEQKIDIIHEGVEKQWPDHQ